MEMKANKRREGHGKKHSFQSRLSEFSGTSEYPHLWISCGGTPRMNFVNRRPADHGTVFTEKVR